MRNSQRRARMSAVALAYRALIIDVLEKMPELTAAEKAQRLADLAQPRPDPCCPQLDLFRGRR
jgi:hypothetical protein